MGSGQEIQCENCFYSIDTRLGVDVTHFPFDVCLKCLPRQDQHGFKELAQQQTIHRFEFSYELFQCTKHHLFEKPVLTVIYGEDQTFTTFNRCPYCRSIGSRIEKALDSIDALSCPFCKKKKLRTSQKIL
ncbi:hypothetical protein CR194_05935 [Salipaludibacillus keqinensis]|uniref:Uncharacterized protein n=1 Tax=Salipaludibacillus keqinensis TaxID=2045207 RepID=A0A323TR91_9BACI|nr:hypothetical protein [Salipaludibacillus keqinensis]PYZ95053.1 hypothetical protein CR194_05935 [Salipaludibacillus keqinensis]